MLKASDNEEEGDIFGPMPAKGSVDSNPGAEIEDRARRMKEKLLGDVDVSWLRRFCCFFSNTQQRSEGIHWPILHRCFSILFPVKRTSPNKLKENPG